MFTMCVFVCVCVCLCVFGCSCVCVYVLLTHALFIQVLLQNCTTRYVCLQFVMEPGCVPYSPPWPLRKQGFQPKHCFLRQKIYLCLRLQSYLGVPPNWRLSALMSVFINDHCRLYFFLPARVRKCVCACVCVCVYVCCACARVCECMCVHVFVFVCVCIL